MRANKSQQSLLKKQNHIIAATQPKIRAANILIRALNNKRWPTVTAENVDKKTKEGKRILFECTNSEDGKGFVLNYNEVGLKEYNTNIDQIWGAIRGELENVEYLGNNVEYQGKGMRYTLKCIEKTAMPKDNAETAVGKYPLYLDLPPASDGLNLNKIYYLKLEFESEVEREAYIRNVLHYKINQTQEVSNGNGIMLEVKSPSYIIPHSVGKPKSLYPRPRGYAAGKEGGENPLEPPIPPQTKMGQARIYPTDRDYQPATTTQTISPELNDGAIGTLKHEIYTYGINQVFPNGLSSNPKCFNTNVAYEHVKKRRSEHPKLKKPDDNDPPIRHMIYQVLKVVLTAEELDQVTTNKSQGSDMIYLPKSAHTTKWSDDECLKNIQQNLYNNKDKYSAYVNKVITDTMKAIAPLDPKTKKELVWFAINRINAEYKSAYFYCKGKYADATIDPELIEYAKFKRKELRGGNLTDNIQFNTWIDDVKSCKFFPKNKVDIWQITYNNANLKEDDHLSQQAPFVRQTDITRNNFGLPYRHLLNIYESEILKENTFKNSGKGSNLGKLLRIKDPDQEITPQLLDVYKNAATLAALDGVSFPIPGSNEEINRAYLDHAYWYTLFKLNGKKLKDYIELKDPNRQKENNEDEEFNPYIIPAGQSIPTSSEEIGLYHWIDKTRPKCGGKKVTAEEMANRLMVFAYTDAPLEEDLVLEEDNPILNEAYKLLASEEHQLYQDDDKYYYLSQDRRKEIARQVMKQCGYDESKFIKGFTNLGLCIQDIHFRDVTTNNRPSGWSQAKNWLIEKITEPYDYYDIPQVKYEKQIYDNTNGKNYYLCKLTGMPPGVYLKEGQDIPFNFRLVGQDDQYCQFYKIEQTGPNDVKLHRFANVKGDIFIYPQLKVRIGKEVCTYTYTHDNNRLLNQKYEVCIPVAHMGGTEKDGYPLPEESTMKVNAIRSIDAFANTQPAGNANPGVNHQPQVPVIKSHHYVIEIDGEKYATQEFSGQHSHQNQNKLNVTLIKKDANKCTICISTVPPLVKEYKIREENGIECFSIQLNPLCQETMVNLEAIGEGQQIGVISVDTHNAAHFYYAKDIYELKPQSPQPIGPKKLNRQPVLKLDSTTRDKLYGIPSNT